VVGGRMSGKERAVNTGELPAQERRETAGSSQSHHSSDEAGNDRGAKGGRKEDHRSEGQNEANSSAVSVTLGIPTVTDHDVQAAMKMVIEPIIEREIAEHSYGFRPGRCCKDALRRVDELLQSGAVHVVDVDIKGYFDSIPHQRLMELEGERIADGRVLALIESFLKQGIMEDMGQPKAHFEFFSLEEARKLELKSLHKAVNF